MSAELVREVVEPGPVVYGLPGSDDRQLRVMRVKGSWLPIVNLSEETAEEEERPGVTVVVLGRRSARIGILVDELGEVTAVAEGEGGRGKRLVDVEGELVRLIDPESLLARGSKLFEEGNESMEETGVSRERRRVVAFGIGGEEFGLDVMNVLEVLRVPKVREVPNAPEFVEGLVDVREGVVPVIDLRSRFNVSGEKRTVDERLLVSEGVHGRVGLIVDDVAGVVAIPEESISSPPDFFKGLAGRYLEGVARDDDRLIILLDIDEILSSPERIALQKMMESSAAVGSADVDSGSGQPRRQKTSGSTSGGTASKGKVSAGRKRRGGVKKGGSRREKADE